MPPPDPALPSPLPPFILTVAFVPDAQARFERLRQAHFPPERNLVPAHVTLFHQLPGDAFALIDEQLRLAARACTDGAVAVTGLRSLGRGVAFTLSAPGLARLRAGLAREWHEWLQPQDRQAWKPHLTIQNKVSAEAARTLLAAMQAGFSPFETAAAALDLWCYLGGPWQLRGSYPLGGQSG